jgi:hypothetical protein
LSSCVAARTRREPRPLPAPRGRASSATRFSRKSLVAESPAPYDARVESTPRARASAFRLSPSNEELLCSASPSNDAFGCAMAIPAGTSYVVVSWESAD